METNQFLHQNRQRAMALCTRTALQAAVGQFRQADHQCCSLSRLGVMQDPNSSLTRHTRSHIARNQPEKPRRQSHLLHSAATIAESDLYNATENELVLVAGASGGVGQLVTAKLLEKLYRVRAVVRSEERAKKLFGDRLPRGLQVIVGDCRDETFVRQAVSGVDAIICCLGTSAFPSLRWRGGSPEETDFKATTTLIENAPETLSRFVLTSSVGVDRADQIPFSILNAFGVLKWKKRAEEMLTASKLPYTIVRPGRLTDGPYTSYDLNTLLKATSGARQDVRISAKDDQSDEASRIAVAEAIVQMLKIETTINKTYHITSKDGEGPGQDPKKWQQLLKAVR